MLQLQDHLGADIRRAGGVIERDRNAQGPVIGHPDGVSAVRTTGEVGDSQNRRLAGQVVGRECGDKTGMAARISPVQPRSERIHEAITPRPADDRWPVCDDR